MPKQSNGKSSGLKKPGSIFDLPSQLGFYGAYHANSVNQYIHFVFVPLLEFTGLIFLAYIGVPISHPDFLPKSWNGLQLRLNVPFFLALAEGLYYTILDPAAGALATSILLAMWLYATHLVATVAEVWKYALAVHLFAWVVQFIGHGYFEGRRPALLDNLFQSLVLAPFFVLEEILFKFGYRPDLKRALLKESSQRILMYRQSVKKN